MNFKRQITNERGQTMTEFALILPILVVLLFGIIQFGIIFNNYVTVTDAARTASRKGAVSRSDPNPTQACQNAGYAAGPNLKNPGTDFVVTCTFQGGDVTVTASYPYDINLLGWVVASGRLNATMKEKVE
jgi:Flp pilus assembly protein TadG